MMVNSPRKLFVFRLRGSPQLILDRNFVKRHMNGKHVTNRFPWGGRDNDWKYRLEQRDIKKRTMSMTSPATSKSLDSVEETPSAGYEDSGVNCIS